jgi:hypothetical protein
VWGERTHHVASMSAMPCFGCALTSCYLLVCMPLRACLCVHASACMPDAELYSAAIAVRTDIAMSVRTGL